MTRLRGICWNHSRGYVPLVAASQRYHEEHPDVEIHWDKRSLRAFGEAGMETLFMDYDLLVIDHPFCGEVASAGYLRPLDKLLDAADLAAWKANSVGPSFDSYVLRNHVWALPIDTACPVATYRPDILARTNTAVPKTWAEVLQLAEKGCVIFPGIDTDAVLHLFSLCRHRDATLFIREEPFTSRENLQRALMDLKDLSSRCPTSCLDMNPIAVYESMARSDTFAYCPFAFGYSNYSREGFAENLVLACDPPTIDGKPFNTVLGGAGIALSSQSNHSRLAADFAAYCMSERIQKGIYTLAGGQPGNRLAWEDDALDRLTHGFFRRTLSTIENSYMRPRYNGFIPFQRESGLIVNRYLKGQHSDEAAISSIM